eukprot:SAG31_NODE_801_length_12013_cov_23.812070_15_plen_118_part_00
MVHSVGYHAIIGREERQQRSQSRSIQKFDLSMAGVQDLKSAALPYIMRRRARQSQPIQKIEVCSVLTVVLPWSGRGNVAISTFALEAPVRFCTAVLALPLLAFSQCRFMIVHLSLIA